MREEKVRVTAFNVGTTNARVAYFISRHEEDKVSVERVEQNVKARMPK